MLEKLFVASWAIRRHRNGVFGAYVDVFAEDLSGQGYARFSIQKAVQAVGRLGRWLGARGQHAGNLSEGTLQAFCAAG